MKEFLNLTQKEQDVIELKVKARNGIVFFWKPNEPYGYLSQWYWAPFLVGTTRYLTAEHYMMAMKARLFNDEAIYERIINCGHPKTAKSLGRQVKAFNQAIWDVHKTNIVFDGNLLKFSQNESLKSQLLFTHKSLIAEASPYDKVWGIGMLQGHNDANDPTKWKGQNLLGKALMEVRNQLRT